MTEMTRFARLLADGTVAEILTLPEGALGEMFHPDVVAALIPAPEGVLEGWRREAGVWSAPQPNLVAMGDAARARRDVLLAACDWTQLADAPLSAEAKADWATYRAALRAVPAQPGFPAEITWPAAPGA
jgi:hypothetical protein